MDKGCGGGEDDFFLARESAVLVRAAC